MIRHADELAAFDPSVSVWGVEIDARVVELGEAFGGHYAISERVFGWYIDEVVIVRVKGDLDDMIEDTIRLALDQAPGSPAARSLAADVDRILAAAHAYTDGPCVVAAEVVKEDNVFPMIPAGAAIPSSDTDDTGS